MFCKLLLEYFFLIASLECLPFTLWRLLDRLVFIRSVEEADSVSVESVELESVLEFVSLVEGISVL